MGKQEQFFASIKPSPHLRLLFTLSSKLSEDALAVYELYKRYQIEFDDRQSIGKRYRRQDEIDPYCVTFDFDSLEDQGKRHC